MYHELIVSVSCNIRRLNKNDSIRDYDNFDPDNNGNLKFKYKNEDINLDNINEGPMPLSKMIKTYTITELDIRMPERRL